MAGGAAGAKFVNLHSFVSITHLPLPESERPREQLGLRLGQLVTPRVGRAGQALARGTGVGWGAGLVVQMGEELG